MMELEVNGGSIRGWREIGNDTEYFIPFDGSGNGGLARE